MSKSKEVIKLIKGFKSHTNITYDDDILEMTDEEITNWNKQNIILEQDIRAVAKENNIDYDKI
jgi:hypothetical protein